MKKALGILVAVMALVMALSSCTAAGTPAGLLGKWSREYTIPIVGTVKVTIEIRDDDTIWMKEGNSSWGKWADIKKCTCNEITLGNDNSEETSKYELSGDTLTITTDDTEVKWTREK